MPLCPFCKSLMSRDSIGFLCRNDYTEHFCSTDDRTGHYIIRISGIDRRVCGDIRGTSLTELSGEPVFTIPFVPLPIDETFHIEAEKLFKKLLVAASYS